MTVQERPHAPEKQAYVLYEHRTVRKTFQFRTERFRSYNRISCCLLFSGIHCLQEKFIQKFLVNLQIRSLSIVHRFKKLLDEFLT